MYTKKFWSKLFMALSLVAVTAIGTFLTSGGASAQAIDKGDGFIPRFTVMHKNVAAIKSRTTARNASQLVDSIPFWSSLFSYNGSLYPYQMVGTDPSAGSKITIIRTEIIPLKLHFSDGTTLDGTQKVEPTVLSPMFVPAKFSSGATQYGDAMQRAEFWKYVSKNKGYHVLLFPIVYPTVTIDIPAASGQVLKGKNTGLTIGQVEINWFDTQLQGIMTQLHISPKTLPIFLDYNTFLYDTVPVNCCILGYHSAITSTNAKQQTQIQTYAFSAYSDPGIFGKLPIEDIHALSHEVAEWYNDPFTDNMVPNWTSPLSPQYGCSNILEVGDPLVGVAIDNNMNGYHPQDIAFFSWFARQTPSFGINGRYTYLGTFASAALSC